MEQGIVEEVFYMPLVSIIIPAFNAANYLPRCLESLLCQTLSGYEIIIIDDGSRDDTFNIASAYCEKDERIRCISTINSGPGAARNKGLELAQGDYICFVDADDFVSPRMLEALFDALGSFSSDISIGMLGISGGDFEFTQGPGDKGFIAGVEAAKRMLEGKSSEGYSFLPCKLYRRIFLLENNILLEEMDFAEDTLFNLKAYLKAERVAITEEILYCYYQNEGSLTRRYDGDRDEKFLRVLRGLKEQLELTEEFKSLQEAFCSYCLNSIMSLIVNEFNSPEEGFFHGCRKICSSGSYRQFGKYAARAPVKGLPQKLSKWMLYLRLPGLLALLYYVLKKRNKGKL
jgi:glycosyltransferase EpsH